MGWSPSRITVPAEAVELIGRAAALVHGKAGPPRSGERLKVSMTALLLELRDER
ncbi:hypothetical protein [Spongiactinospora sp. TRM90649]|uniref:hypothetical protein n=1 Tax=Spongiactinospora sp. TRM90649 TaxID=3031114 RepID=UPI0023F9DD97|nr:hypothetical protein [Spongiactinospora sp. TRM90649]MDF5756493.1 hypothetical protein [Spongiactinospora sp. TRM90649]